MAEGRFSIRKLLQTLESEYGSPLPDQVKRVLRLAFDGHHGQFRISRDSAQRIPYIVHPVGTALVALRNLPLVHSLTDNRETVVCIALTHDLLEDSRIDGATLETVAGTRVREVVEALTKPPAGVRGKTPDERNREFLDQIEAAGTTAAFIKLCDSLHNLSRPASTPPKLYRKQINKAKAQYLTLLDRCSLGEDFNRIYREAITSAENQVEKEERYLTPKRTPDSLEKAINECVVVSSGKILEFHDIVDILGHACNAAMVSIWQLGTGEEWFLVERSTGEPTLVTSPPKGPWISEAPHSFTSGFQRKDIRGDQQVDSHVIYTVPMQLDPIKRFLITLDFGEHAQPPWFSLDAATMLVQFLAQRLIVAAGDRRSELATTAAMLGLQINLDVASQLGVQPSELGPIEKWRLRCQQAIQVVEHFIKMVLLGSGELIPFLEMVKVESRVKSINSILRKFSLTSNLTWPNYHRIEDIAGVRVVCPTISFLKLMEEYLQSDRAIAGGVRLHPSWEEPHRDYIKNPTSGGYKAVHLILEVETFIEKDGPQKVPCEMQLRTIFQDIWANISHQALYKSKKTIQSKKDYLTKIGEAIDRCEYLLEKLLR